MIDLIFRHFNGIAATLASDPDDINPMFECVEIEENEDTHRDGKMWSHGFLMGVQLNCDDWHPLMTDT
ncbi:MAG: UPF0149 family protein [Methylococcaceae bacterium]|nr:UPF0149 family protein [Methylococcaceae bacterium]